MKKISLDEMRIMKSPGLKGYNEKFVLKKQDFSWSARVRSFVFAWTGIIDFFKTEPNARIHLAATIIVTMLCLFFKVSKAEVMIILFSNGFVWVTEMLNTAIEKIIDFISIEKHSKIRFIKDVAAGAVLVAAVTSAVSGLIIFVPKIWQWLN